MPVKKLKPGLYVITDDRYHNFEDLYQKTKRILQAGISILQYRNKHASLDQKIQELRKIKQLCNAHETRFIVNDDVQLAEELDIDGVHLGEDDASCAEARLRLGEKKIIGVSCYNDLERAKQAEKDGADYVAFGAMFPTNTKVGTKQASTELISIAKQEVSIPVVAIGGITPDNCRPLIEAGVDLLAVISSVYLAAQPEAVTKQFNRLMKEKK